MGKGKGENNNLFSLHHLHLQLLHCQIQDFLLHFLHQHLALEFWVFSVSLVFPVTRLVCLVHYKQKESGY